MAIMDWYSRSVIDWQLSTTLEANFCVETLNRSLSKACCGIFNTDQGSQFTSNEWMKTLITHDVTISVDGRGRCFDNIFIERLWRSVKYECIFLKEFEILSEVRGALIRYFKYYNTDRYHQKLEDFTPAEVYLGEVELEGVFKKNDIYNSLIYCPVKLPYLNTPLFCRQNVLDAKMPPHHCLQRFMVLLNTWMPKNDRFYQLNFPEFCKNLLWMSCKSKFIPIS